MIPVSTTYNNIIANGGHYEWRVLNGANTFDKTVIVTGSIINTLFSEVSVGNANASQLNLTLQNPNSIDAESPLQVQFRANTWDDSQTSEWYTKGWYYIDTFKSSPYSEVAQITAFDALIKANQPYQRSGEWLGVPTDVAVNKIANDIGVTMDVETTDIFSNNPYGITVLEVGDKGTTERELLEQIAAAYGGNFFIDENNCLQFYQLSKTQGSIGTAYVGDAVVKFDASEAVTIQRARLWVNDGSYYLIPGISLITHTGAEIIDHNGREITAHANDFNAEWDSIGGYCVDLFIPWGTYEIALNAFYSHLDGKSFIPYDANNAFVDPKYGLWDSIEIKDIRSKIVNQTLTMNALSPSSLSISHNEEMDSQFPFVTSTIRRLQYQVAQNTEAVEVTIPQRIIDATNLITGGNGGYVKWNYLPNGKPSELLFMDNPNIEHATYIMRLNRNGIGFSRNGGETYDNAWTIDGKLNADNIATGTINAIDITGSEITGSTIASTDAEGSIKIEDGSIDFYENASVEGTPFSQLEHVYNSSLDQHAIEWHTTGYTKFVNEAGGQWTANFLQFALGAGNLQLLIFPDSDGTHTRINSDFLNITGKIRGGNENITATAGTNVSFVSQKIVRNGSTVSGYIRFTTSATISAYGYICSGLPAFATPTVFTLYDQYNGLKTSPTIYADTGNTGLRVAAANLTAGTYNVYFSYLTSD